MFSKVYQPGLICIFDADNEKPLKIWEKKIQDGSVKRILSDEIRGLVLEISSKMPMSNYIYCPSNIKQSLNIYYPYLHLTVKLSYSSIFAFDVLIIDDENVKRRFRISTIQTFVDIQPFMCKLPLSLESGWNEITVPLHHYVKSIYGTNYSKTQRVAIYSNCFLKKIYFSDKEYSDEDIPLEFHIEDIDFQENYQNKLSGVLQKKKMSLKR
ncbi:orf protein, putative [Pediculus humanus corporis]|uniref:Orf protein, putative n=1 Tax=Pediculus humanus subsp. corporis TaxID=121224 RepID=E0VCC0_PEDHC|nr:orf protein, putative [Pediculus humanus corporis]EEB11006.1 orf protein, putative [Pediculus humanus corporis]